MDKTVSVNGIEYEIITLLGHGKDGYSYLAISCGRKVVLKQIHHEPCDYWSFENWGIKYWGRTPEFERTIK